MDRNISQLILEDREKRYNEILAFIGEYDLPVLCSKLNYPGGNKNTKESSRAFEILSSIIKESFGTEIVFLKKLTGFDGSSILAVVNMHPLEIKKITCMLEDRSQLGRIFDIDVYVGDGSSIGREMIDMSPRKCIICEDDARICVRSRKHSLEETLNKVNDIINNYGD